MMLALLVPLLLCAPMAVADVKSAEVGLSSGTDSSSSDVGEASEEYLTRGFNWIGDRFLGVVESLVPEERAGRANGVEGRRRKKKRVRLNKYVFPLIVGFLLMKSIILPLALKALAILSGKAVVLSIMSLILAAIVGLRSVAGGGGGFGLTYAQNKADLANVPVTKYRRKDILDHPDQIEDDPYNRYYSERRRRRRK